MPQSSPPPAAGAVRGARGLAEALGGCDDDALAALVTARPDLARPVPADLATLAARALSPASIRWAIDGLDTPHLRVLEAIVLIGPARCERIAELLVADEGMVRVLVEDLVLRALVREQDGAVETWRPVAECVGPVAGLAPVDEQDADVPADLDATRLLADAPQGAAEIVERLTWGPPTGVVDPDGPLAEVTSWLVDAGLLRRIPDAGPGAVILPRPVALALRSGRLTREGLSAPAVSPRVHEPARVDEAAGARAGDVVGLIDEIADAWGHEPPRVLRAGGLSVRDLGTICTRLDLDVHRAGVLLETMRAARLLADDGGTEPVWAPTHLYDTWVEQDDAARWADLAIAWLDMPRAPHLIGTRQDGVGVNALAAGADHGSMPAWRREVLGALARRDPGEAIDAEDVTCLLAWDRPRRVGPAAHELVPVVLAEAEFLGVTAAGALSGAGRALLASEGAFQAADSIATALRLPEVAGGIVVQADLTAIAPGRLDRHLAAVLRRGAVVESRGGAQTFRFTADSLGRLLDDGWEAEDILRSLSSASLTPLPQPLVYLVGDVARRHGRARLGAAGCYVRSDDVAALDALLARPDLGPVRLRRIAPTVLVSPLAPTTAITLLRAAGVSMLVEGADGAVVSAAAAPARASAPRPRRTTTGPPPDAPAVVAALRRASAGSAGVPPDPAVAVSHLRAAVADGETVLIDLAGSDGTTTRLLVRPTRINGGLVHGVDVAGGRPATWPLHRIRSATPHLEQ